MKLLAASALVGLCTANYKTSTTPWDQHKKDGKYQIAYSIDEESFPNNTNYVFKSYEIDEAIEDFNTKTNIQFVPQSQANHEQWMHFTFNSKMGLSGCSSWLGRMTNKRIWNKKQDKVGEQDISLGRGCDNKPVILSQIMHALGFMREHLRKDRDEHITINWENLRPAGNYQFRTCSNCETFGLPYDTQSVTHFHGTAFSKNGEPTIIGENVINSPVKFSCYYTKGLTKLDACKINNAYPGNFKCSFEFGQIKSNGPEIDDCDEAYFDANRIIFGKQN